MSGGGLRAGLVVEAGRVAMEAGAPTGEGLGAHLVPPVSFGARIAKAGPEGPAPLVPTLLVDLPSIVGYGASREERKDIVPDLGDIHAHPSRARTPAGSTSRPGGPFQPVARRGFGMPRIGASAQAPSVCTWGRA